MQFVSLDSLFDQAEYIRHGLDFNRLWDNVNTFLTNNAEQESAMLDLTKNNYTSLVASGAISSEQPPEDVAVPVITGSGTV